MCFIDKSNRKSMVKCKHENIEGILHDEIGIMLIYFQYTLECKSIVRQLSGRHVLLYKIKIKQLITKIDQSIVSVLFI